MPTDDGGAEEPILRFMRRCGENGFRVARVGRLDNLLSVLSDWALGWEVKRIALAGLSSRLESSLQRLFADRLRCEVLSGENLVASLGVLRSGSLGVFRAHAGVAETGGLVVMDDWRSNLASLVPEYSVGLLEEAEILHDYWQLAELVRAKRPAGLVIISGPSSTSDIELTRVVGVHGPVDCGCIIAGFELDD